MRKSENSTVRTAKYLSIIIDPQDHLIISQNDLDHDPRQPAQRTAQNHDLQRAAPTRRLTHLRVVHRPRHPLMMVYQIPNVPPGLPPNKDVEDLELLHLDINKILKSTDNALTRTLQLQNSD